MRESRTIRAAPRAGSLIESMRDLGYSIETAVADIIDNSITAGARRIDIRTRYAHGQSRIMIVDDGEGMLEDELVEAMRPGTKSPTDAREEGDLGRFGLGLKTASFSQCRRLTVVSRKASLTCAATWDLDRVVATDDWTLDLPDEPQSLEVAALLKDTGTVVVWEKLDRLEGEDGTLLETEFARLISSVEDHLALVFHRFILGRRGARQVAITINGRKIEAFDPFFPEQSVSDPEDFHKLGNTLMKVSTYTLPHFSRVSKKQWDRYAGPEGYVKNQGFYVFRGNRLIVYGTWFGLMRQGELTKLTRVALDLPTQFDAHWKVDVKKASAQPPPEVRKYLRGLVERMGRTGKTVFKHKGTKQTSKEYLPVWRRVVEGDHVSYEVDLEHPTIAHLLSETPDNVRDEILAVFQLIAGSLPLAALYNDVASSPETTLPAEVSGEALNASAARAAKQLYEQFHDRDKVTAMIQVAEPFARYWSEVKHTVDAVLEKAEES